MQPTINLFRALTDETRLRILALLVAEGELCVCDIMATLQLPQSKISRHLAYLKKCGWVNDRREGVWIYYSLAARSPDLRTDLIQVLKKHLPLEQLIMADRKRFMEFGQNNSCA